jgi:hypothetical protein
MPLPIGQIEWPGLYRSHALPLGDRLEEVCIKMKLNKREGEGKRKGLRNGG